MNSNNFKKNPYLIFGCFALIIGIIAICNIIIKSSLFQERDNSYSIDNVDTNIDNDSVYFEYIIETLTAKIKDEQGVADCKIDVGYSDGKIASANVSIIVKDEGINVSETNILNYISQTLEIDEEDIVLSYN